MENMTNVKVLGVSYVLHACPCCKSTAEVKQQEKAADGHGNDGYISYAVVCTKCGLQTGYYVSLPEVPINIWNNRPDLPDPNAPCFPLNSCTEF